MYDMRAAKLSDLLRAGDTTKFYELWSSIPEDAMKEHLHMGEDDAKDYRGRAKVKVRTTTTKGSPTIYADGSRKTEGVLLNHAVELVGEGLRWRCFLSVLFQ